MCALKSPMSQVLSNTSVKVLFGSTPIFFWRGGMDVPVPLLLSCLCPTQLLEIRGFFSILDRQGMCDLQNLLKVSPKAGLNLSAASVPGNGQHNKHNSHFFLMSNLPLTANSYVPRPSGDYFPTQGIYSRTNSPVKRAPHT